MRIEISERLRPFSHTPGLATLIPGTSLAAFIYPAQLVVYDHFQGEHVAEIELGICGPVEAFTVIQDLEKGHVEVSGQTSKGYMRYSLEPLTGGKGARLVVKKAPEGFLSGKLEVEIGEAGTPADVGAAERLSLGSHKKQEWDRVRHRLDLREILPVWHRLGQLTPPHGAAPTEPCLLNEPFTAAGLLDLFRAGFRGLLTPTATDTLHHGLDLPPLPPGHDPTLLLSEGSRRIRSLFVAEQQGELALMPSLLPELHCGRMTGVTLSFGTLSFEWSKKSLRRAILRISSDAEISLRLQSHLKRFRLTREGEKKATTLDADTLISVRGGELIFLDRFEK